MSILYQSVNSKIVYIEVTLYYIACYMYIFRNTHIHTQKNKHVYATIMKEIEAMNLREQRGNSLEGLEDRKGR